MQAWRGWIEPDVIGDLGLVESLAQGIFIGVQGNQATPLKFIEQIFEGWVVGLIAKDSVCHSLCLTLWGNFAKCRNLLKYARKSGATCSGAGLD